jgi:hypothetical protein
VVWFHLLMVCRETATETVVRARGVFFFDVLLAFVLGLVEENVDGWCLVIRSIEMFPLASSVSSQLVAVLLLY